MLSYSQIIKDSYRLTVRHKILWLFGALVLGGFNANFLRFQNFNLNGLNQPASFYNFLSYLQLHPAKLALLSFSILAAALISLVLTNWSRIMLVLIIRNILQTGKLELRKQFKASAASLATVIKISLITTGLMLAAAAGILGAPLLLISDVSYQTLLWIFGSVIFIPLAFTMSCINIFTTYFAIIFQYDFKKALDLGTDFFAANWIKILSLSLLLIIIYSAGFVFGAAVFFAAIALLKSFFLWTAGFGILKISAMMIASKWLLAALLWALLAALNVFFNTALVTFFLQLITPIKQDEQAAKEMAMHPISS